MKSILKGAGLISFVMLFIFSVIPVCLAQNEHIKLLAVSQDGFVETGEIVDLYLEVYPGSGRVFIDSYPLTKMDTQVSTRFANRFACDYTNIDCSKIDFIYTIRSNSPIIGGPSASAAIAALTIAKLTHSDIDESTALTGTLNSGGIIGVVGGVDKKVIAAKNGGIKKVLIPNGVTKDDEPSLVVPIYDINTSDINTNETNRFLNSSNESDKYAYQNIKNISILNISDVEEKATNWTSFAKEQGIEIVEVITMEDVLKEFGIKNKVKSNSSSEIDTYYIKTMKSLAKELCDSAKETSLKFDLTNETKEAFDLRDRGLLFYSYDKYYSGASQCFASASRFRFHELKQKNITEEEYNKTIEKLKKDISEYVIPYYTTIMDLQAYSVVKERLIDAENSIEESEKEYEKSKNLSDSVLESLAYAIERFNTANAWSTFITHHGTKFNLDEESLKSACLEKLQEAQEINQYVDLYVPQGLFNTAKESLDIAYNEYNSNDFELCIFSASKSKAENNMILTLLAVEKNNLKEIIDAKLEVTKERMNSNKNSFPIVGYSYYEYAEALNEINDSDSALLYSEYALELSAMNLYFSGEISRDAYTFDKNDAKKSNAASIDTIYVFLLGFALGILIMIFLNQRNKEIQIQKEHDMYIKIKKRK